MLAPIFTTHLFPLLDEHLLSLLCSLSEEDWEKQSIAPLWRVKDIAAHLLDGNIRTLSMLKDGYFGEKPGNINSYLDLVGFLNQLNADWVKAMRRTSPSVLASLLESTGKAFCGYISTLDPFAPALFSVAWAGEESSPNWFHIAREYTEKWHHQQQIRLAVGQEAPLYSRELYFPYLDTSMRALPHHYRTEEAAEGAVIQVQVPEQGDWFLERKGGQWHLAPSCPTPPSCLISIDGRIAWRLFTKGISKADALPYVRIEGDQALGNHIFGMLAVMA